MVKFNFLQILFALAFVFAFIACNPKDENPQPTNLTTKTFKNLYAPQTGGQGQPIGGEFTKFSFSKGIVVNDNEWDIAFRGTTILVNGGAKIGIADEPTRTGLAAVAMLSSVFDNVKNVPSVDNFKQDGANLYAIPTGSGLGWYNYNAQNNLVTPIAGKVLVVKTHDGKYAKMEILSYYKDAPSTPDASSQGRYFTLKYVYQANGTSF